MIQLELQLVIGKGRTGDFTVLYPENLQIADPPARMPVSWLHIHTSHAVQRSVAIWRDEVGVMLAHAWQESGTDHVGRPLPRIVVYHAKDLLQTALAELLLWLYRQNFDGVPAPGLSVASGDLVHDSGAVLTEERDIAVAALALGADVCRVQNTRTAQDVLDRLSFEQIGFLALVPNAIPAWPLAGPGVVVSRSPWLVPADAADLARRGLATGALDLSGFMRIRCERERRRQLAIAALSGDLGGLTLASDQELDWLISQAPSRAAALALASPDQIAHLAQESRINVDELEAMQPGRLARVPAPLLATLLRGRPNAIGRFVAALGPGTDGVEDLLPPRAAELARARHGPVALPERIVDMTIDELGLMDQAGVFETMPLRWLTALGSLRRDYLTPSLSDRLNRLLPKRLSAHLLGLDPPADDDDGAVLSGSPPEVAAEWLAGIDYELLVEAGRLCVASRAWRHWWVGAMRAHPASAGRDVVSLSAPWSRETAAWLVASARDGEISAAEVRARVAAFLEARAPMSRDDVVELLRSAGFTHADDLSGILSGDMPRQTSIEGRFASEIRIAVEEAILKISDLQDALRAGLPVTALSELLADANAYALLDSNRPAPVEPPKRTHPIVGPELRRRGENAAFWKRWPAGVPVQLREWIREQLGDQGGVVAALTAANERSRLLDLPELMLLSGGLAPLDLVWQVVECARHTSVDRAKLLDLLDDGRLRAELIVFLRCELQTLAPCPPVPVLTVAEMMSVFPLLHPAKDIVRQIMVREAIDPGEDMLLERTVAAIQRLGTVFPLPGPAADQAVRRTGWIRSLSGIPGWEHWRCKAIPI